MRSVYISHAPGDRTVALEIEEILGRHGSEASRAPDGIEGDPGWPQAVGDRLREIDTFVLLWSEQASKSPLVQFEWTTAVALKKPVVPCLTDDTPLPPALAPLSAVRVKDVGESSQAIVEAVRKSHPQLDPHDVPTGAVPASQTPAPEATTGPRGTRPRAGSELATLAIQGSQAPSSTTRSAAPGAEGAAASGGAAEPPDLGARYRVLDLLGRGGMGAVYHAYDNELDRDVALKLIRPDVALDPKIFERFKREIQLSTLITHENVLRVYDLGESQGVRFLSMQYVKGETLGDLLEREGNMPIPRLLRIFRQVCLGLKAAHDKGVLHRDLKPDNVMIDDEDRVYLTDFGIAKSLEQTALTQAGEVMGTPHYMSPEQVKGQAVDVRSDIYSLGVILYEMATGQVPYSGNTVYEVMIQRVQKSPQPAIELNPDIPGFLEKILKRCMTIEKTARYASIEELLSDLDQGMETGRASSGTRYFVRHWREVLGSVPGRTWAWTAPLVLLVAAGGWWLFETRTGPAPPVVQEAREPVSVLVADFRNETGDAIFEGTLEETLGQSLEGASFVTTYNRGRARRIAGQIQEGADRLDEAMARLVAQREGISVIVDGSISAEGESYRVGARAVDALTGNVMVEESAAAARKIDVLGSIGRLSARIRQTLGDTTPESAQLAAAETFTTASLEAAQNYAIAQELQGMGRWDDAIPRYQKAVDIDPDLGRAYAGLAVMYRNLGKQQDAEKYYQMAMAHIDRMSDRERYRTRGGYFVTVGSQEKAIEEFQALVDNYPADFVGYSNLALAHFLSRDMSRALEMGRRATAIYPKNVVMRTNLALYALYAGDFEASEREARALLDEQATYGSIYVCLALSSLARGEYGAAAEAYRTMEGLSPSDASVATMGLADLAAYEGRLDDAVTILERGIREDRAAGDPAAAARKTTFLASVLLELGRKDAALRAVGQLPDEGSPVAVLFESALVHLRAGREDRALELASDLGGRLQTDARVYANLIEGYARLGRGNPFEAVQSFLDAQKLADTWLGRFALGRAFLEADGFAEAYSEFEQCMKRRGEAAAIFLDDIPTLHHLPEVSYYLGRAQEGLKSPAAADSYRSFLSTKKDGADTPTVKDARRRLAAF